MTIDPILYVRSLIDSAEQCRLNCEYERSKLLLGLAAGIVKEKTYEYYVLHIILGNLLSDLDEYKNAEESFLKALEYFKKNKQDSFYSLLQTGLFSLYIRMGNIHKAEIYKEDIAQDDLAWKVKALINKVKYCLHILDYQLAEKLILEAKKEVEKAQFTDPTDKSSTYTALYALFAETLYFLSRPKEAKAAAENALQLAEKIYPKSHIVLSRLKASLALYRTELNEFEEAENQLKESLNNIEDNLGNNHVDYLSVLHNMFMLFWKKGDYTEADKLFLILIEKLNNFSSKHFAELNENEKLYLNDYIFRQGQNIFSYACHRKADNPIIIKRAFDFRICSKRIVQNKDGRILNAGFEDVQQKLKENEAAIEIVWFYNYDNKPEEDLSKYYLFFIITKETKDYPLSYIIPGNEKSEERYFAKFRNSIKSKTVDFDSYKHYWKGINELIDDKFTIYVSTDGPLMLINLNCLLISKGKYLIDEKEIIHVNDFSCFDLTLSEESIPHSIALVGNPDFGSFRHPVYVPLPETGKEVLTIGKLLFDKGWNVNLFTARDAIKNNLITSLSSEVIHIATHAYFLNMLHSVEDLDSMMENSGLLLSNPIIKDNDGKSLLNPEGIINAREIKYFDLSHVKLVVLSSCETGLGNITNNGALFGLQRAFFIAGAEALIISLFKVPDEATRELMTEFYNRWLLSKDKNKAFREAQLYLKSKYKYPFYWGGFIMIND